ncbi:MAG: ribonuclease III [Clostridiales bacterium]|jgi:ribonuclease-3|nr:ribonuclease III [Clostridiales bacterium]
MLFEVTEVEKRIRYTFKDKNLLRQAFTHASYSNECHVPSNERLEFLGDSVLNFFIAEYLYKKYPDLKEGELTRKRAEIVSAAPASEAVKRLGLVGFMLFGAGERKSGALSENVKADLFESIVGAIYLDGGIKSAARFIRMALAPQLKAPKGDLDPKSYLEHLSQKRYGKKVKYVTIKREGKKHSPQFTVSAVVGGRQYEPATAPSKKKAEQLAAKNALFHEKRQN